jgi:hypothetical protein
MIEIMRWIDNNNTDELYLSLIARWVAITV